ncbi:MAG TPA: ABC transporter substrate-binding protein [Candidatus Sumerlaeota bacterium]|nr:ABC transporter substrate-binding protein [Candidatus Sumerlaeota bacterium]
MMSTRRSTTRFLRLRIAAQWLALCATGALLLCRLGQPPRSDPGRDSVDADGTQVVDLWCGVIMGRWDESALQEAIDRFNARHPDIRIEPSLIPYTVYNAKLNLAIACGAPPDIVYNAVNFVAGMPRHTELANLLVPVPDSMVTPEMRRGWGETILKTITQDGRIMKFPDRAYLGGMMIQGNLDYLEMAGVDVKHYLSEGWDYETFKRELKRVQQVVRERTGREVYAFGLNLVNVPTFLFRFLLPPIIGADATERSLLAYDPAAGRYVLDPAITPEILAQPLQLMQDMIHRDQMWGRKYLGMDFGQIGIEIYDRLELVTTFQDTPGNSIYSQLLRNRDFAQGLREAPLRVTNLPVPTPTGDEPFLFSVGTDGWGVMRQVPYKGDAHTSAALQVARYLASPEVQALRFRYSDGMRNTLWPDPDAVEPFIRDLEDPIRQDPWLAYLWDLYESWMKEAETYLAEEEQFPDIHDRRALLNLLGVASYGGYFYSGQGKQTLERVLFNQVEPLQAAREMLAGAARLIDDYYRQRSSGDPQDADRRQISSVR